MGEASRHGPVFNVAPVVTVLLGVLLLVQLMMMAVSDADALWLVQALGFIPNRYEAAPLQWPGGRISAWTSPLTHMFVHGDWSHLALNGFSLLAFGGVLARRLGAARFLAFAAFTGLAGAALFWLLNPDLTAPMIGASGAISGMLAAALRLMFSAIDGFAPGHAGDAIRNHTARIPMKSLAATLTDRRIITASLVWLAINGLGAFGLGTPNQAGPIAWEAHVGGYIAGLLGFDLFDRAVTPEPDVNGDDATEHA